MFSSVNFPLYKDDGRASIYLNGHERKAIKKFTEKLRNGTYNLKNNPCMCGHNDDILVSGKDRYGISGKYVLCRQCGLVRQAEILDDASTALFYRDDYRDIYSGRETASDLYFQSQVKSGKNIYQFVSKYVDISKINTVFEAGCSAGGNLYEFHLQGKKVSGCDFGEKYIAYGRNLGMDLYAGEPNLNKTPPGSQDLVILSHVLEHLNNPREYVNTLAEIISPGGYFLVLVPGIFTIKAGHISPIRYFQNAHVYSFHCHYLRRFFAVLGLEIVYGDEECSFLLRKPETWTKKDAGNLIIWDDEMPEWSAKVAESLKSDYLRSHRSIKYMATRLLDILRVKGILRKLLRKR